MITNTVISKKLNDLGLSLDRQYKATHTINIDNLFLSICNIIAVNSNGSRSDSRRVIGDTFINNNIHTRGRLIKMLKTSVNMLHHAHQDDPARDKALKLLETSLANDRFIYVSPKGVRPVNAFDAGKVLKAFISLYNSNSNSQTSNYPRSSANHYNSNYGSQYSSATGASSSFSCGLPKAPKPHLVMTVVDGQKCYLNMGD